MYRQVPKIACRASNRKSFRSTNSFVPKNRFLHTFLSPVFPQFFVPSFSSHLFVKIVKSVPSFSSGPFPFSPDVRLVEKGTALTVPSCIRPLYRYQAESIVQLQPRPKRLTTAGTTKRSLTRPTFESR